MKPVVLGAILGVLWLLLGWPVTVPAGAVAFVCQPVILAFAAGLAARPHLPRLRRWA
ncbi:hypothetical protein AB0C13_22220 [Streptomyces sp. NPDC049099]|uniref:hypothetical protein n=1 Tax=Streptomyces sp. NPDC049099 TaxID=3155768 RepID=UPI00343C9B64